MAQTFGDNPKQKSSQGTPFRLSDQQKAILVLLPSVIALAIFVYAFIAWTAYISMTDAKLSTGIGEFIGLDNYVELFTGNLHQRFRTNLVNTVFFTTMFIGVCLGVGLLLAVLLDQKIAGEGVFRTIYLFPMALSFIVTAVVWKWLFHPTEGINKLPEFVGLAPGRFDWYISRDKWFEFNWSDLGTYLSVGILIVNVILIAMLVRWYRRRDSISGYVVAALLFLNTFLMVQGPQQMTALTKANGEPRVEMHGFNVALFALVIAAGWQMSGYTMAMYLAGLRGIPEDLREAARVDGATEWGVYRHVILPLLAPITLSAMIVLGHISLKIFDLVYGMGGGDNVFIDMPSVNMFFTSFRGDSLGRGAAIAMILLIMVAVIIVPYLRSSLRAESDS